MTNLTGMRGHFDIPDHIAYFNCAYMSPLLREARRAGEAAVSRKSRPWELKSPDFFTDVEEARGLFAKLIGASADDVALVPSAGFGLSTAAMNIATGPGRNVLVMQDEFPSNYYPWSASVLRSGGSMVRVPRPDDGNWTPAVIERITPEIAVAAVSPCHWTDGSLLDLEAVRRRCDQTGSALVVDATQWLGAVPFSVATIRPDFLAVAAYKWLLGPYSGGFLYADPRWQRGRPLEENWFARVGSEDFRNLTVYRDEYRGGAQRYDVGERSNFILIAMLMAGLRQILEWTPERIGATIAETMDRLMASFASAGLDLPSPKRQAPHLRGFELPASAPADVAARLASQNVFVSMRGRYMRISPHVWNTAEDIERLTSTLKRELHG